jgi:hypothetical protein
VSPFWVGFRGGYIRAHQLALLVVLACSGCQRPVVYVPAPPPVVQPPPTDPTPPPPPTQNPPTTVAEILDKIDLGMSFESVIAVFGRPPQDVPGATPANMSRWYVVEGEKTFLVFVVMDGGRVVRKGSSVVEEVR